MSTLISACWTTDVEGWSLDIHHRLDPLGGVVYRGDGTILDLTAREKLVYAVNENFTKTIISPQVWSSDIVIKLYI
jgi:hypothetical protein